MHLQMFVVNGLLLSKMVQKHSAVDVKKTDVFAPNIEELETLLSANIAGLETMTILQNIQWIANRGNNECYNSKA